MNSKIDIKKTKKRIKKVCAPHKEDDTISCFDKETLISMIKNYNKKNKSEKIFGKLSLSELKKKSRRELWIALHNAFKGNCDDERCWKDTYFNNMKILNKDLKPLYPESWNSNKNEWLSTSNIEKVCSQFEDKYKDFMFIGAVPIDFDDKVNNKCVVDDLCKFNLTKFIKSKKHRLGIIFNLDPHYKDGSHWVCMYADFKKGYIVFFDSYGYKPVPQIQNLIDRLKEQNEMRDVSTTVHYNTLRHQYKYSECGMYCIYFIKSMLEGKKYSIMNNLIPDDKMEKLRTVFYYKEY